MPRLNPNQLITMTLKEKWALDKKAKQGWKCYFIERDTIYDIQDYRNQLRENYTQIKEEKEIDITHLRQIFMELYEKVGDICDCPICFNELKKENTYIPHCGHLICKECKTRCENCPICRKEY